jgi:hypothetical protein
MPLGVLSCLGFALDGLRSILVTAFAYAITAGFCVLMISWPRLCSITLAHHSLCVFLSPFHLSIFYFLFSISYFRFFFFFRLDFSLVNGLIARTLRLEAYCLTRGYFVSSFSVNQFVVLCRFPESNINAYIFGSPIRTSRTIYNHMQVTGANSYTIDR